MGTRMKKQIVRISPVQNAKLMAAFYLVISLPLVLAMGLSVPAEQKASFPAWLYIVLPVFYCVLGFVFTLIGAWVYNQIAARIGGFEFTTAEIGRD